MTQAVELNYDNIELNQKKRANAFSVTAILLRCLNALMSDRNQPPSWSCVNLPDHIKRDIGLLK
ncbi:hypothetical protein A8L45_08990 [Veronia pacifica]|uniref:Uncharacterized protein n=1 Tax=Veronia pacifica TaxID=1080227 RepID=A0A1C3EKK0_9GAMM|nr:hypothetical protein A8L45_08990 [Veronia pacifica]